MSTLPRPIGSSFLNIPTAASNAAIKSGAGVLHKIIVNTPIAAGTVTVYDSLTATGTKIATVTFPSPLVSDGPVDPTFDVAFATGLTVVTTGTNMDTTITYQ